VHWDLGLQGLGILVALALGFGIIAQFVGRAGTRWDWLIGAAAYFVGGLFVSEIWFGEATIDELQPIIDGLMFDEVLLISLFPGILAILLWRFMTGGGPFHRPVSP